MKKIAALLISLALVLPLSVNAHAIWLAKQHGQYTVVYGEGANSDPYGHKLLSDFKGWQGNQASNLNITKTDRFYTVEVDKSERISFQLDNGYFTKNKQGEWLNKSKDEVTDAQQSGQYIKYAVAILDSHADVSKPLGLKLEIVPEKNPLMLKIGDELPLTVYLFGKPLANAKLNTNLTAANPDDIITTDSQGRATMVILNHGLNVLEVSYQKQLENDPKVDYLGLSTTLSFSYPFSH